MQIILKKGACKLLERYKKYIKNFHYKISLLTSADIDCVNDVIDINDILNLKDKGIVISIKTLMNIVKIKDEYTFNHIRRVALYAKFIADELKLNSRDKLDLIYAAYMHDIGKIHVPTEILIKKIHLNNKEWLHLREHTIVGFEIIRNIDSLKNIAHLVLHHHEKYDGSGYPLGLKGENIPYLARILTVVDSFDAMTSKRHYNNCKTLD